MNEKCINTEAANVKKNGWIPAIPIEFDEVTGYINNSWYDLDKLLTKLKADPNVIDRDEIKIEDIMDYDDEDGHTKAIAFKYLLPLEAYEKLADKDSNFVRNYILKEVIKTGDCQIESVYEKYYNNGHEITQEEAEKYLSKQQQLILFKDIANDWSGEEEFTTDIGIISVKTPKL